MTTDLLSETPKTPADPAVELSARRTGMSFQRTRMSADRTLMSVIRTSLSLIGFGFTIYQFFQRLREAEVLRGGTHAARNFGLALILEGVFRRQYGVSGQSYDVPELLQGATNLGFMIMPNYRGWVVVASITVCLATWYLIERTRLGAYLRAGTENAKLVQAFGVNVPLMVTLTYGVGAALAGLAGVLAAPIIQVTCPNVPNTSRRK